jgi:hypothetical protein
MQPKVGDGYSNPNNMLCKSNPTQRALSTIKTHIPCQWRRFPQQLGLLPDIHQTVMGLKLNPMAVNINLAPIAMVSQIPNGFAGL